MVADTRAAYRVLETNHPPSYYLPPSGVNTQLLTRSAGARLSEPHSAVWCRGAAGGAPFVLRPLQLPAAVPVALLQAVALPEFCCWAVLHACMPCLAGGTTFCEWKGEATYWDVTMPGGQTVKRRSAKAGRGGAGMQCRGRLLCQARLWLARPQRCSGGAGAARLASQG